MIDQKIKEQIIGYFQYNKPSSNSFKLNNCTTVLDAENLISVSIARLDLPNHKPYLDRLREIKVYIENEKKINNIVNN